MYNEDSKYAKVNQIIGRRIGETNEITAETIRATGLAMGLTEVQIAKAIEVLLKAQEEKE